MILVTGATGTVGSELARQLIDAGRPLRIFVRNPAKAAEFAGRAEIAVGDLSLPETLPAALDGVDELFLVTYEKAHDIAVLAAAKKAGVRHIVKLSTGEATEARVRIGKWAREREILIERSGIAWTFLRPDMFMSNSLEWWAPSIKAQGAVYFPGGKGKAAPVAPADIAAVAARVLTTPGHDGCAYDITGPQQLSIEEMVQTIGRVLGKPIQYTNIPPLAAGFWMARSGMSLQMVAAVLEVIGTMRRGEMSPLSDTVQQITGRSPITYEAWCRAHIESFR